MCDKGIFKFEQFIVKQDRSAMKIGTDAVLLGAWTSLDNYPNKILDIGAGTGILSLIMAQRSNASAIDAIETNADAYEECVENFEESIWNDRLFCYYGTFQDLVKELVSEDEKYDLIISNPPFFSEDYHPKDKARIQARTASSLPFSELLEGVKNILDSQGVFSVVIPYNCEEEFCQIARKNGLYPKIITRVKGNFNSPVKRSMLLFSQKENKPVANELVLEKSRHQYTDDYKRLVQDFYIFEKHKL